MYSILQCQWLFFVESYYALYSNHFFLCAYSCFEFWVSCWINKDKQRGYDKFVLSLLIQLAICIIWACNKKKRLLNDNYWKEKESKEKRKKIRVSVKYFNFEFKMLKMSVMLKIFHVIALIQYIYAIHYDLNYVLQQQKKLPEVSLNSSCVIIYSTKQLKLFYLNQNTISLP